MRLFIIIFLNFIIIKNTYSQIPIGLLYDINGFPFHGYFDPMIYSPKKKISETYYSNSYEPGFYYKTTGDKIKGLIKIDNKNILFKKNQEDVTTKLGANEIKGCTVGADSFLVIQNLNFYVSKIY